jgi:RNA polymerase sigma-70 factor, ECF subfamily
MSSNESDAPLGAERASHGDRFERVEFERLFRECAADVHGYAISLLRDAAAAEDVTAIAFERVYRSRGRLDRRRGTPRAWLFAIARNAALDELRRRKRQPLDHVASESASADEASAEAIERVEHGAALQQALGTLAPREREIVLLKFHGELTNSELARVLGVSESNAGTRLHRALLKLRAACTGLGIEEVA